MGQAMLGRSQLWALGLHLQLYQEAAQPPPVNPPAESTKSDCRPYFCPLTASSNKITTDSRSLADRQQGNPHSLPMFTLPDRKDVTMSSPFMAAYVRLLIRTCHKRGVHAMGGMAAFIPIKNNPSANEAAMAKVQGIEGVLSGFAQSS
eukprot:1016795-Pelagomonas_calceolata.AAC.6